MDGGGHLQQQPQQVVAAPGVFFVEPAVILRNALTDCLRVEHRQHIDRFVQRTDQIIGLNAETLTELLANATPSIIKGFFTYFVNSAASVCSSLEHDRNRCILDPANAQGFATHKMGSGRNRVQLNKIMLGRVLVLGDLPSFWGRNWAACSHCHGQGRRALDRCSKSNQPLNPLACINPTHYRAREVSRADGLCKIKAESEHALGAVPSADDLLSLSHLEFPALPIAPQQYVVAPAGLPSGGPGMGGLPAAAGGFGQDPYGLGQGLGAGAPAYGAPPFNPGMAAAPAGAAAGVAAAAGLVAPTFGQQGMMAAAGFQGQAMGGATAGFNPGYHPAADAASSSAALGAVSPIVPGQNQAGLDMVKQVLRSLIDAHPNVFWAGMLAVATENGMRASVHRVHRVPQQEQLRSAPAQAPARPMQGGNTRSDGSFRGDDDASSFPPMCRDRRRGHSQKQYEGHFVRDETLEDGAEVMAGSIYRKVWVVQNCGTTDWPEDTKVVSTESEEVFVGKVVAGRQVHIAVTDSATHTPPSYAPDRFTAVPGRGYRLRTQWTLCSESQHVVFGPKLWSELVVLTAEEDGDETEADGDLHFCGMDQGAS